MYKQSLCGSWEFRYLETTDWSPAVVPGGVHTDLLALGSIPDPFVRDNELAVQWVAETDWEYQRSFVVEAKMFAEDYIYLICQGLDTLADVYLNDHYLGHTDNMFRRWEWSVKQYLQTGDNHLRIVFGAPVRYIRSEQERLPLVGGGDILGGPHLRKAPCHWGWDWGPKLPPIGIWKDILLEGRSVARFSDVHLQQSLSGHQAQILVAVEAQVWGREAVTAAVKLICPTGEVFEAEETLISTPGAAHSSANVVVHIPEPQLWYPNGYGSQPLYQVEVALKDGDQLLDAREFRIGIRTLELRQEPDSWGKSFTFYVNGIPIFAKGANWIPADSFPTRLTVNTLEYLIESAQKANMNMLRVWGGGYYPEDMFYDLCDRYGILIWQDFIFACGIYPADTDFYENFEQEAVENIRRLRHHACLALWCGNNEMEQGWCDWGWNIPSSPVNQRLKSGYDRIFHHLLPDLLATEDPEHAYWPSSASSNQPFENPNGQDQGDCHYWDVWHGRKPFTAYRSQFPRFMSEFGFQALPPMKTIQTYAEPKDWNITSYVMEHHQRSGSGNSLMVVQMLDSFRLAKDFPALVYLSMVLQAEGIRYGVEHWRRNRNRVSGTLIWQLNDCWPVASWSSIDYFGRWKALHYFARRFYAPLLLSVENWERVMNIHVTSDLTEPWNGMVRWQLTTLDGDMLDQGEEIVRLPALQDTLVKKLDFIPIVNLDNQHSTVLVVELWGKSESQSGAGDPMLIDRCVVPFVPNKHLELIDPGLAMMTELRGAELVIKISAQSLARFVELDFEGADAVFSDNYFDLPAGQTQIITCALPSGWTLAQAQASIRMRSLYDSYL